MVSRPERGESNFPVIKLACEVTLPDAERIAEITGGDFEPFKKDNIDGDIDNGAFAIYYWPERAAYLLLAANPTEALNEKVGTRLVLGDAEIRLPNNAIIIKDDSIVLVGYEEKERDQVPFDLYTITTISKTEISYRRLDFPLGAGTVDNEIEQAAKLIINSLRRGVLIKGEPTIRDR